MKLSEHFSLAEMITTQVRNVSNEPSDMIIQTLKDTARRMEMVRSLMEGKPVIVTSGYRSGLVNKLVGGSVASAHMQGRAVDFICPEFGTPLDVARAIAVSAIEFDQLIEEGSWVHISFDPRMRGEVKSKGAGGKLIAGLPGIGRA